MAGLLRKHNEKLAAMYTMAYKQPTEEHLAKKFNNAKITNIRVDRQSGEMVIETSKGTLVMGVESGTLFDPILVRGVMK